MFCAEHHEVRRGGCECVDQRCLLKMRFAVMLYLTVRCVPGETLGWLVRIPVFEGLNFFDARKIREANGILVQPKWAQQAHVVASCRSVFVAPEVEPVRFQNAMPLRFNLCARNN